MHVTYSGHFVLYVSLNQQDDYWHSQTLKHLLSINGYQIIKPLDQLARPCHKFYEKIHFSSCLAAKM